MVEPFDPNSTVLLVVDVQAGAVGQGPYRCDEVLANIGALIDRCRAGGVEVVYVQHDGKSGEDEEPGTPGWEIHPAVGPASDERVVRKRFNSAFRSTDLESYLRSRGIETLILVGIQTEYCVDTSCRVAFELGFRVIMPELTNTTFDNGDISAAQIHEMYNRRIWADRFAAVPSMSSTLDALGIAATG